MTVTIFIHFHLNSTKQTKFDFSAFQDSPLELGDFTVVDRRGRNGTGTICNGHVKFSDKKYRITVLISVN